MKLYSYNKCGTCRKAKKFLDACKVSYDEIDITETPPTKTILKQAIKLKGIRKLFNTSGEQYKKLKIKDKIGTMTEAQAITLLSGNGKLVKRPVAVDGSRITVGFDENEFKEVWSKGK
ncbi:MAG: Spx/MgsR family RNA polymerase-binding regulatory protein [Nitrospinae bacterium]|nr:Spx/MgsR family RNA polymerase-binding regulatory protein [Nitrospinota bacterium]